MGTDKEEVMKRLLQLGIFVSAIFVTCCMLLTGCATTKHNPYPNDSLINENWARQVEKNPNLWARSADRWFRSAEQNETEIANRHAPISAAITTMHVKASNFDNIRVDGDFQVQIFGTFGKSSVYIFGPNNGVRRLTVNVANHTLCVSQDRGSSTELMHKVIVRIGINYLRSITQAGCGSIEGISLHSNALVVNSSGPGPMYLSGNLKLRRVNNTGAGNITIYGINTSCFDLYSNGSGTTNLTGDVSIRTLKHCGTGNVNIIGATPRCPMNIYTVGAGKIGIAGQANITSIIAKGNTCVYVCSSVASQVNVCQYDRSTVGMTGVAQNLVVDAYNSSRFNGRYLCVRTAFVRAHDYAHINVSAGDKIFAASTQSGSVYFYGEPKIMSQFVNGSGVVLPLWSSMYRSCGAPRVAVANSYKGEG